MLPVANQAFTGLTDAADFEVIALTLVNGVFGLVGRLSPEVHRVLLDLDLVVVDHQVCGQGRAAVNDDGIVPGVFHSIPKEAVAPSPRSG